MSQIEAAIRQVGAFRGIFPVCIGLYKRPSSKFIAFGTSQAVDSTSYPSAMVPGESKLSMIACTSPPSPVPFCAWPNRLLARRIGLIYLDALLRKS